MSEPNILKAWRTGQFPLTPEQEEVAKEYARILAEEGYEGVGQIDMLSKAVNDSEVADLGQFLVAMLTSQSLSDDKQLALVQAYLKKSVRLGQIRKELQEVRQK